MIYNQGIVDRIFPDNKDKWILVIFHSVWFYGVEGINPVHFEMSAVIRFAFVNI
jgi:hypothetical protein